MIEFCIYLLGALPVALIGVYQAWQHYKYKQISEDLYKQVEEAEQSRDVWYKQCQILANQNLDLEQKLAKFERHRDESGKFIAKK